MVQPGVPRCSPIRSPRSSPPRLVRPAHGARELDREPGKSTDGARVREPRVGPVLRDAASSSKPWRLRQDERQADQPGTVDYLADLFVRDGNWSIKDAAAAGSCCRTPTAVASAFREDAEEGDPQNTVVSGVPASALSMRSRSATRCRRPRACSTRPLAARRCTRRSQPLQTRRASTRTPGRRRRIRAITIVAASTST